MMKILFADDHDLVHDVMAAFLSATGDFEVVTSRDLDGALAELRQRKDFELVVLDFSMPGMNGLAGLQRTIAAAHGIPVALISGTAPRPVVERALDMGAAGFLPKTLAARSLANALRFMAAGERYLPLDMARPKGPAPSAANGPSLSAREAQVLASLCGGRSNKEIAAELGLREPTVKLHVKLLCRKLEARNRTHAVIVARELGIS